MLKTIFVATLIIFGIVGFNNCSQPGKISVNDKQSALATDPVVQEILQNCQTAQSKGTLVTLAKTITFDVTRVESGNVSQICEFAPAGQITAKGNLDMLDGQLRSRYEQNRSLGLPDGAVLCDVQIQNDLQSFRYDDVFFFSFNGYLLASNDKTAVDQKLTPTLSQIGNQMVAFYKYDWASLRTAPFKNVADDYCLGGQQGTSSCTWPISEQQGNIKFSFDQELLIKVSANTSAAQQSFNFAITGDNDPSLDCYHEKLQFTAQIKYYLK